MGKLIHGVSETVETAGLALAGYMLAQALMGQMVARGVMTQAEIRGLVEEAAEHLGRIDDDSDMLRAARVLLEGLAGSIGGIGRR